MTGPAFPPQQQEPPGRTDAMTPVPDHGEESYQGNDRLVGRTALITGGDSGIGRAVALAFAREGADVAFTFQPPEEVDAKETQSLIETAGRRSLPWPSTCLSCAGQVGRGAANLTCVRCSINPVAAAATAR